MDRFLPLLVRIVRDPRDWSLIGVGSPIFSLFLNGSSLLFVGLGSYSPADLDERFLTTRYERKGQLGMAKEGFQTKIRRRYVTFAWRDCDRGTKTYQLWYRFVFRERHSDRWKINSRTITEHPLSEFINHPRKTSSKKSRREEVTTTSCSRNSTVSIPFLPSKYRHL